MAVVSCWSHPSPQLVPVALPAHQMYLPQHIQSTYKPSWQSRSAFFFTFLSCCGFNGGFLGIDLTISFPCFCLRPENRTSKTQVLTCHMFILSWWWEWGGGKLLYNVPSCYFDDHDLTFIMRVGGGELSTLAWRRRKELERPGSVSL